ncbi:hypothetical protein D9M70_471640 [compost metagenome]
MDGDGQGGAGLQSAEVGEGVGEFLDQGFAGQAQCLYLRVVVVQHVLVAAIGAHQQVAEGAVHQGDAGAEDGGRRLPAQAHGNHAQHIGVGGDVDVGVVVQQVAARVDARDVVEGAAGFHGVGEVGVGDRRVIHRRQDDLQAVLVDQRVLGVLAGEAVAVGIAEVAEVAGAHRQGVETVEVEVAEVDQVGQRGIQVGEVAGEGQAGAVRPADGDSRRSGRQ